MVFKFLSILNFLRIFFKNANVNIILEVKNTAPRRKHKNPILQQHKKEKKEPVETLLVQDSFCLFPVCIHHVRNAQNLCSLFGQAHHVFPGYGGQVKVPAASHQLLQSGPCLLAVTVDTLGTKPKFHRHGNVCW